MTAVLGVLAVMAIICLALLVLIGKLSTHDAGGRLLGILAFLVFVPVLLIAVFSAIRTMLAPLLFGFVFGAIVVVALVGAIFFCAAFLVRFTR
jgi:hypothetical protein